MRLSFENGKKYYTDYRTPYGEFLLGIDTRHIEVAEFDSELTVTIEYDMEFNSESLGRCTIDMKLTEV